MLIILMPKTSSSSKKYTFALGRRKSAVATVKLFSGKGENVVNGRAANKYFSTPISQITFQKPFQVTATPAKFYFLAKIIGGGPKSQAQALSLALARALTKSNEGLKPILRQNGLLTVDSRVRQRRMIGTGGKARRQKQSPKR